METVDDELRALMDDMLDTMYDAPGIGLAAVQIGVPKRVIVMDLARQDEPPQPLYEPYTHLGHFNYDVDINTGRNLPFRVIRDFVVLPNRDDHELMLCKAYLQLGLQSVNVFYCYFLLGHRLPIEHEPW